MLCFVVTFSISKAKTPWKNMLWVIIFFSEKLGSCIIIFWNFDVHIVSTIFHVILFHRNGFQRYTHVFDILCHSNSSTRNICKCDTKMELLRKCSLFYPKKFIRRSILNLWHERNYFLTHITSQEKRKGVYLWNIARPKSNAQLHITTNISDKPPDCCLSF